MKFALITGLVFFLLAFQNIETATIWRLQCANLNAAQCKEQYGKLLHDGYCLEFFHLFKNGLDYGLERNEAKINELRPDESEERITLEERENSIKELRQRLIDNRRDCSAFFSVIKHTNLIERPHESSKNDLERYYAIHITETFANSLNVWKQLYDGLRSSDLEEYSEYELINELIANTPSEDLNEASFSRIDQKITQFFDITKF